MFNQFWNTVKLLGLDGNLILYCTLGALAGSAGDVLILSAARGEIINYLKLISGILLYASCGAAWYFIVKATNGSYSQGASIWSFVGAIIAIFIAIWANEKQTVAQWLGFLLIIAGVIIRGVAK